MAAAERKTVNDDLCRARGFQLAGRQLEAADVTDRGVVQVTIPELEPRPADLAELLDDVDLAVSIRIAEADDAPRSARRVGRGPRPAPQDHVDVAVPVDDEMPAFADAAFMDDQRAKSRRQRQTAIAGIARR